MKKNKIELREILWKDNKYCYWCGIETILLKDFIPTKENPVPPDMATIEHLYSRHSEIPRLIDNEKFIACFRCNSKRAKYEDKLQYKLGRKLTVEECEEINNRMWGVIHRLK